MQMPNRSRQYRKVSCKAILLADEATRSATRIRPEPPAWQERQSSRPKRANDLGPRLIGPCGLSPSDDAMPLVCAHPDWLSTMTLIFERTARRYEPPTIR